jgi:hypothetical protein
MDQKICIAHIYIPITVLYNMVFLFRPSSMEVKVVVSVYEGTDGSKLIAK